MEVIKKVSIIIPVYNGEKTIAPLVNRLRSIVGKCYDIEVVLVNDFSPSDNSEEVCIDLAQSDSDIKFINLAKNVGEHNAVMAGLNYCTGDCAVIMDDDFQNPPEEVIKLIDKLKDNKKDVIFSYYDKKEHHLFRNIGSKFNNYVASLVLKKPIGLYLSSFKIVNRFLIDEIIKYKGSYPYIDGLILRSTGRYGTVKVRHNKREEGQSGYTMNKLISLWLSMFTNFSVIPLRIATVIGFFISFISIFLAFFFIIEKLNNPSLLAGWASTMVMVSFLGGVQLFTIGMLGEYLGRLFLDYGGKPQYVVRSSINCKEMKG